MNVDNIPSALQSGSKIGNGLFFPGGDDFASKLTIGQVIKAKILRHHEGSRYVADFNGQQKIIDSANPLQPGELIEARVRSLGKQVEIQRINVVVGEANSSLNDIGNLKDIGSSLFAGQEKVLQSIRGFFAERQSSVTLKEIQIIREFLARGISLNTILLSALSLKKANIELNKVTLDSVISALNKGASKPYFSEVPALASLGVDFSSEQSIQSYALATKSLAESVNLYAHSVVDAQTPLFGKLSDGSLDSDRERLPYRILNTQDDSSVNHRLIAFPIWLDGKLVEVNMALFDQYQSDRNKEDISSSYKRFVFTLALDNLGEVVATATVYGKHIHLILTTESTGSTDFLARHMASLINNVEEMGWIFDKVEYATADKNEFEPSVAAVVEHYVAKDSVSRVF